MILAHNETIYEALESAKEEIEEINYALSLAIDDLEDALESESVDYKNHCIEKVIRTIKDSRARLFEQ